MSKKYFQGIYTPKNPQKYKGNVRNIIYRSSYERKFFEWCDLNPNVLEWSSEEIIIPYLNPLDNKVHRYFPDVYAKIKTKNGIEKYLIEIKPFIQTKPPKKKKRITKRYINEVNTYIINKAKWESAEKYANSQNMKFIILTEKEIFGK